MCRLIVQGKMIDSANHVATLVQGGFVSREGDAH